MMIIMFTTYLMKFATDVLLIAPAAMGMILAASRLYDAVSDPLVGYLSDNTRSTFGRRRIWMYGAAVPVCVGMIMLWSPPESLHGWTLIAWMILALLIYETASTSFYVPHGALGFELTPSYHERTRLFGYSHMIMAIGLFLGLAFLQLINSAEDKRQMAFMLSMIDGVSVAVLILYATSRLQERSDYQGRGGEGAYKSFVDTFRNPHARLLFLMYGIETFGISSVALITPYLVEYVIPMQAYMVLLLTAYVVPQFAFTPVFIWLSRKTGKKNLWLGAMIISGGMFSATYFLVEPGQQSIWIWVGTFIFGMCGGVAAVMSSAIQADIIDFDEYETGERKEGAYYAVWNLIRKGAASLVALVVGFALQLTGFEANTDQSYEVQLWILGLFSILPGIGYLIGALVFARFSFNEREHAEVRAALEARKLG